MPSPAVVLLRNRLRRRFRRLLRSLKILRQGLRPGLISVIVPCYDVENYIEESLTSILTQDYRKLEVLVVDDSSTDETLLRVRSVADADKRVRIFVQEHRGVNAARNLALKHAHGEYLAFLDGDDILAPGAYSDMVRALRVNGTDFVVGAYDRIRDGEIRPAATWIRRAHRKYRARTTVRSFPQIMVNAVQWTKLYKRDYWNAQVGEFAEPGYYQDQPVSARAYAHATSFSILSRVVVHWRVREERTSMTQQVLSVNNMRDRFRTATEALIIFRNETGSDVARKRHVQYLNNDIAHTAAHLVEASDGYWTEFRSQLQRFISLDRLDIDWTKIHARHKVLYHLVLNDLRSEVIEFRAGVPDVKVTEDFVSIDGEYYITYPFWNDVERNLPRCLFRASTEEQARIAKAVAASSATT